MAQNTPPGTLATDRARPTLGIVLAASVGSGVAHLGTSTMPFQVGALMDGAGMTASAAGTFGFFQVGALAITMLLVSPIIHRYSASVVAFLGAIVGILAHILLFVLHAGPVVLWPLAMLAGAGYGLVFAAMVTGVASTRNPDRVYAIANGGALLVIVALMAALPTTSSYFGPLGPFLGIAVLLALTAPAFLGFRGPGRNPTPLDGDIPFSRPGVRPLLLLWTAFSLGSGAIWSFAERIGAGLMLSSATIGFVLSASTFCGIAGTGIAAVVSGRMNRSVALAVGTVGTGLACLLLGYAWDLPTFALAVLLYWVFYMFLYSYLLGTAAAIDSSGRVGTAGGGCERFGFALGAPIGGLIVDHLGFYALGVISAVCCVALLPFCLPVLRRSVEARAPA